MDGTKIPLQSQTIRNNIYTIVGAVMAIGFEFKGINFDAELMAIIAEHGTNILLGIFIIIWQIRSSKGRMKANTQIGGEYAEKLRAKAGNK